MRPGDTAVGSQKNQPTDLGKRKHTMKQISTTFCVNGRAYTFAPGQLVPYLFRLGTRRAPPLSCEALVIFTSADEAEPLIRLRFFHPRLHTVETRWLTGKQFWRAAPGSAEEWLRSQPPLRPAATGPMEGGIDREHTLSVLRVGKRISKRLDLLQGRDLIHLLTRDEQAFMTQGYNPVRCYYLGPYLTGGHLAPLWHEQQLRGQAFEMLRAQAGLSVHEFALLDAALLELQHERAVEDVLRTFYRRAGSDLEAPGG